MQLDDHTQDLTHSSIQTLGHMMHVPPAAADVIKADLAGLLLQILPGPLSEPFRMTAAYLLYFFSCQPASRQQLLEKLTPDSAKAVIDLSLKSLEAPDYDHAALVVAAGVVCCRAAAARCSHGCGNTCIMMHQTVGQSRTLNLEPHICTRICCREDWPGMALFVLRTPRGLHLA